MDLPFRKILDVIFSWQSFALAQKRVSRLILLNKILYYTVYEIQF